jgi:DNA invertase Pin-like site-specific DNA recombinase
MARPLVNKIHELNRDQFIKIYDEHKTLEKISNIFECSVSTVRRCKNKHCIESKSPNIAKGIISICDINKHDLEYAIDSLKTDVELSKFFNCSRVLIAKARKLHNIHRDDNIPPKKKLIELYKDLTLTQIANTYNVDRCVVKRWFKIYGIRQKTITEVRLGFTKPNPNELQELFDNYGSISSVASVLNASESCISDWQKEYNIQYEITRQSSKEEILLFQYMNTLCPGWIDHNKKIISPYEIDMMNNDLKIAIEYNGLYWHSENGGSPKKKDYHKKKYLRCKNRSFRLITIFENEWLSDENKVKSILNRACGKCKVIDVSECKIIKINNSIANDFFNRNSLNKYKDGENYGLYLENDLLYCMSLINNKSFFEFKECYKIGYDITNPINFILDNIKVSGLFKTTLDLRYDDINRYINYGFKLERYIEPYCYYMKNHRHPLIIEAEWIKLLEDIKIYDRIFDCGHEIYFIEKH